MPHVERSFPTKTTMVPMRTGTGWICRVFDWMGVVVYKSTGRTREAACDDAKKWRKTYIRQMHADAKAFRRLNRLGDAVWTGRELFLKPKRRAQKVISSLTSLFSGAFQPAYG